MNFKVKGKFFSVFILLFLVLFFGVEKKSWADGQMGSTTESQSSKKPSIDEKSDEDSAKPAVDGAATGTTTTPVFEEFPDDEASGDDDDSM